jgi:hypothetical protein
VIILNLGWRAPDPGAGLGHIIEFPERIASRPRMSNRTPEIPY